MRIIKDNRMENAWIAEICRKPVSVQHNHTERMVSENITRTKREFHNLTAAREWVESYIGSLDADEVAETHEITIYQVAYQWTQQETVQ